MDASQYPVTFPYGSAAPPYSPSHRHQGEDRAMPRGTPVIVNGTVLGLSGNTGASTGPHLHIQKVSGGQVVSPNGGGFNLSLPAVVFDTGWKIDIGNFVRVRDAKGTEWSYFHLSGISAKVGDKLGVIMANVTIVGAPASVTSNDGSIHVFARGSDNRLWQKYFDKRGWQPWVSPVPGTSLMSSPTVNISKEGHFHVFGTGPAGDLIHWWFTDKWNGAESLGLPQGKI